MALVFPGFMMMAMLSAGAVGAEFRRRSRARSEPAGGRTPTRSSPTRF
jgi:hypothetical protein